MILKMICLTYSVWAFFRIHIHICAVLQCCFLNICVRFSPVYTVVVNVSMVLCYI